MPNRSKKYDDPRERLLRDHPYIGRGWRERRNLGALLSGRGTKQKVMESLAIGDVSQIDKWVRGDTPLPNQQLVRLAWLFNVSIPYLLDQTERPEYDDAYRKYLPRWGLAHLMLEEAASSTVKLGNMTLGDYQDYAEKTHGYLCMSARKHARRARGIRPQQAPGASSGANSPTLTYLYPSVELSSIKGTPRARTAPRATDASCMEELRRQYGGCKQPTEMPVAFALWALLGNNRCVRQLTLWKASLRADYRDPWELIREQTRQLEFLYQHNDSRIGQLTFAISSLCRPEGVIYNSEHKKSEMEPERLPCGELLTTDGKAIVLEGGTSLPVTTNGQPEIVPRKTRGGNAGAPKAGEP